MKPAVIFLSNSLTVSVLIMFAILFAMEGYQNGHLPWSITPTAKLGAPVIPPAPVHPDQQPTAKEVPSPNSGPSTTSPRVAPSVSNPVADQIDVSPSPPDIKYKPGEDPEFARKNGWPVDGPKPLPGAILPDTRIVAFYGNPLSYRMGILGKSTKEEMLHHLQQEVALWEAADPSLHVQPALHLIAVTAQSTPGTAGKYRMIMLDKVVKQVYAWAKEAHALLFIDIQPGQDDIRNLLPRFEWILKNPDVHLGIDPEFNLGKSGAIPGTKIGTFDAEDVNYITRYLRELVQKYHLPPKVLTVHRFTQNGVTNFRDIELSPEIQIVMHMDGWGGPWLKRDTYKRYIVAEPVQYAGFKLFYDNDTKKGNPLMTPEQVLKLNPKPLYIQYQ